MGVYRVKTGSILPLGKQGENLVRQIHFDLSRWISNFGPGTVQLLHQRSGDETPYPVAVEQEGNLAVWTVTSADTAAAGTGRAELQYYVGDALAKSETWMTKVLPALGDASETPPEAQQGWVDQVLQAGAAAAEAADRAEEAAVRQPYPNAETGTWWVWNAESGAYEDTGISYGTGDSGGGVTDHEKLTGRDKADQHPMSAITGLEDALAGKQPTGTYLTEETDPTVPDWAKEPTKPGYTASEVGADPSGTASSQVSAHNTGADTHSDIRLLIQGLTERLNALADSDDTTLDQLSEVVAYIKSNRSLIEDITTSKVSVADIIDNLTTNAANKPLSAAQGVALKALIDAITIPTALPNPNALTFTGTVTGRYDGSAPLNVAIPSGGGGLTVTNTAAVGQTVKITAVDENGQPTEWEAVDMASSGGGTTSDEWIDLGTLTLADGEEAINFLWEVNGQVKKIHIEGVYYSATSGKNLALLNNEGVSGSHPLTTYDVFQFPSSDKTAMYMDLTVEELYPGYWFGCGGSSSFNNPHVNTITSYSSPKRVDRYLSLGEYWRNTPLTAGTWFNVKVVYY